MNAPHGHVNTIMQKNRWHLTHQWLDRAINRFKETEPLYGNEQFLFPIVQGGTFDDLRKISAEKIASCGLEGNAIGGLSVGEPAEEMYRIIRDSQ